MDLRLGQERLQLSDADLLGEGGEARVYGWRDLAVKVFHPRTKGSREAAVLAQKLEKLARFPSGLPTQVVAPQALVADARGRVVGYAMRKVPGAEELSRLTSRSCAMPAVEKQTLLAALAQVLAALHARGVVVGDCNDGNVLFTGATPWLIDADSMQLGGFPCAVGHERFLDPRLYGVDLADAPAFDAGSDWYAFAVMALSSWLFVHPFGGVVSGLPTMLRRAEARHSVLRGDVKLPKQAAHPKVLSDDALGWFSRVFEQGERLAPPESVLKASWSRCACGVEHARAVCPECHALGPLATRPVLRQFGRCALRSVFRTSGRVLACADQGGARWVVEDGGEVRREDGTRVHDGRALSGARYVIAGRSTWVAEASGSLERVVDGQVVERASTGATPFGPAFAASTAASWRTEGPWLVEHERGTRVGQVLEGQTRLFAGERFGFGLYRAGGLTHAFVMTPGKAGLRPVAVGVLEGKLDALDASFGGAHALVTARLSLNGVERVRRWLVDAQGQVLAHGDGRPGAGAVLQGRAVVASDDGLLALQADSGHLVEKALFHDARELVAPTDVLFPQPDGALVVVGARTVDVLSLLP